MPEIRPVSTSRRAVLFSGLMATLLAITSISPAPTAAADELRGPAPSPTRSGEPKGGGTPPESEPTGRLIVTYRDGVSQADRGKVRAAEALQLVSSVALPNAELVAPAVGGVGPALAALERRADVVSVEPEYRRTRLAGPIGEPLFGQQWALNNTGQSVNGYPGVRDVDMNVPEAWQVTTGSPSLVVAVIDDGVDFSHPDLAGRKWVNSGETPGDGEDNDGNGLVDDVNGWDFCNDDATVHDADDFHGTHVAGSIAASGNGAGVAGIAPNVKIMAIKFISDDPACGTDTQAIAAIAYARSKGARIINASWGGYDYSGALFTAIKNATDTLIVAAAGNDNNDNDATYSAYPASYDLPNILSVASIHNEGFLTDSTNYGATSVDLSAPGEDILSSVPGGSWELFSGTSMAAANATGVAALAASAKPTLLGNGTALRAHLINTARALPSTLGWVASPRLIDARAAVVSRPDVRRLSGGDRYATAAAISAATFTPGVPYLFIATGAGFPDALAGSALAAQTGSPLLLVSKTGIPAPTLAEIKRLEPYHIFVLGGTGVVSNTVLNQLAAYDNAGSGGPIRLAGADRYATAAAISRAGFDPSVPTAFIATGANFPDALAGAPASSVLGGPLLLATKTSVPAATATELSRLKPRRIVILGGIATISSTVAATLDAYTAGPVSRMAGADRYATAAAVAAQAFPVAETAFVANGLGFPDALAGGPSAGAFGGPLLLVSGSGVPTPTRQQLQRLQPARIFVLGGTSVVPASVVGQITALFP